MTFAVALASRANAPAVEHSPTSLTDSESILRGSTHAVPSASPPRRAQHANRPDDSQVQRKFRLSRRLARRAT
eukprot:2714301-Heterocapsa_arctica.AAC.1